MWLNGLFACCDFDGRKTLSKISLIQFVAPRPTVATKVKVSAEYDKAVSRARCCSLVGGVVVCDD